MTLRKKRVLFTRLTARLLLWISDHDWSYGKVEVAMDEWTVKNPRLVKVGTEKVMAEDRVHHPRGLHPQGLACDLLIYIGGKYLREGDHPIWQEIDAKAREMNPEFGLGIRFGDPNHLSLGEGS